MTTLERLALLAATLVVPIAAPRPAAAEPADDLELAIAGFKRATDYLKDYWSDWLDERYPEGSCHAALASARAAGVEPTADQQQVCTEFVAYHRLAEAHKAVTDAKEWLFFLANINMATNHEENGAKMAAAAATCSAEVDRLIAAGMPTDIKVRIGNAEPLEIPMSEAKAKVCAPLAKAARSFAKDVGAARTKAFEQAAAPYKAVGITGDRLELLADHVSYAMYGVGGGELRTPKQLKAAAIIFELLGPGTNGGWTLRRYQFRGDKLVKTTSRDFLLRPGAKYFR